MNNNSFTAREFLTEYYKEIQENGYNLNPKFLKGNARHFIKEYDYSLTQFISTHESFNAGQYDLIEIEKAFILILLKELKKRYQEIKKLREDVTEEYLQLNNIPISEVKWFKSKDPEALEWDDFMRHKDEINAYEMSHEKIEKEAWTELLSYRNKERFLRMSASRLGYIFSDEENRAFRKIDQEVDVPSPEYHNTTGTQKLLYLQELGLIDYLKQVNPSISTNKLAKVLGAITGEKYLQPALNAMEGEQKYTDKKSPYFSKRNLPRIQDQLIQWGFNPTTQVD